MPSPAKLDQSLAILAEAADHAPAVHTNSFGAEGVVLSYLIAHHAPTVITASLDTGRLPEETYAVAEALHARYGITIEWHFPEPLALQGFVREHGVNAFYRSVELRRACCGIRKVQPLARMLAGRRAWLTGRRREQGSSRAELPPREWDEREGILKFNPLLDWTDAEVWEFIRAHDIPYNALHDRGYPSIGCAPCSRAVTVGEDPRAGRWWWEQGETRECGLHTPGRAVASGVEPAPEHQPIPDVNL
jgi:phosphoadenosine phosphosulfate reductase